MEIVTGKSTLTLTDAEVSTLIARYDGILIDVGTGDGRFVLNRARERPGTLCIGLDPVAGAMRESAFRAGRKPQRGGVNNAVYIVASVEALPRPLAGVADEISINYPWGSLLAGLVRPEPAVLSAIAGLGKPGAMIGLLINYSIFGDSAYLERLGLPDLPLERMDRELAPAYRRAGIELLGYDVMSADGPHGTSWGRRLVRGAGRETLAVTARTIGGGFATAPST